MFSTPQQIFCDISHRSHRRKVNLSDFYLFIACFQNQLVLTLLSFEKSVAQHNYMITGLCYRTGYFGSHSSIGTGYYG
jgi:hypothetical protein